MRFQSRAETLDQVSIAIQVGLFGQPVERASRIIDRRKRWLYHIDALNDDSQPLRRRYAAPLQFVSHLACLDVVQDLSHDPIPTARLLQRIGFALVSRRTAYGSRINAESLRKLKVLHPVSVKQPWKTKVSFDAARLGIDSVFLVA